MKCSCNSNLKSILVIITLVFHFGNLQDSLASLERGRVFLECYILWVKLVIHVIIRASRSVKMSLFGQILKKHQGKFTFSISPFQHESYHHQPLIPITGSATCIFFFFFFHFVQFKEILSFKLSVLRSLLTVSNITILGLPLPLEVLITSRHIILLAVESMDFLCI